MEVKGLQGVCILAHFCETHGPNFIFCSQLVTENNNLFILTSDALPTVIDQEDNETEESNSFQYPDPYASVVIDSKMREQVKEYAESQKKQKQEEEEGNNVEGVLNPNYDISKLPTKENIERSKSTKCQMCSSIEEKSGYISANKILIPDDQNFDQQQFYGISGRYPADILFPIIRRISVRALSCEVCPGLEGPLVFSEAEGKFFALSFMFKLKDFNARGHSRSFSLILLMEDCTRLLGAYNLVTAHFKKIVQNMQLKAEKVFSTDSANGTTAAAPTSRFNLRSARGMVNRSKANLRSLIDLLDNKNLFKDLHIHFTHILTVVNSYISSKSFGKVSFDVSNKFFKFYKNCKIPFLDDLFTFFILHFCSYTFFFK